MIRTPSRLYRVVLLQCTYYLRITKFYCLETTTMRRQRWCLLFSSSYTTHSLDRCTVFLLLLCMYILSFCLLLFECEVTVSVIKCLSNKNPQCPLNYLSCMGSSPMLSATVFRQGEIPSNELNTSYWTIHSHDPSVLATQVYLA